MSKFRKTLQSHIRTLPYNLQFIALIAPAVVLIFLLGYLPIFGNILAFKSFRFEYDNFIESALFSPNVGFDNFKFLFASPEVWAATRNSILYNFTFLILGSILPVLLAIMLTEIVQKKMAKLYQTLMFLPHFLTWVVVSYFVMGFLSVDNGIINGWLKYFGHQPIQWYSEPAYWPFILVISGLWKTTGYGTILYLAAIAGVDKNLFEAAMIDGANRRQQIWYITIPHLRNVIVLGLIMGIGGLVGGGDFGQFFILPLGSNALFDVTTILPVYIMRTFFATGDIGMMTAAGLLLSTIGFILTWILNKVARKYAPDGAIF